MTSFDRRRILGMLLSTGAVVVLPACGGGGESSTPTPTPAPAPPAAPKEALLLISTGRSNASFEMDYGQNHRVPDLWDVALDGPQRVTTVDSTALDSFRALEGSIPPAASLFTPATQGVGGTSGKEETAFFGIAAQLTPAVAAGTRFICSAYLAEGAKSMPFLSRPTADQIRAGAMSTPEGMIPIPATSAEAKLLASGRGLISLPDYGIDECATRWYRGIWALAGSKRLLDAAGYSSRVLVNLFRHAEPDQLAVADPSADPAYRQSVVAYFDTLNAALREIFGQEPPLHCIDVPSHSFFNEIGNQAGRQTWLDAGKSPDYAPAGRYGPNGTYIAAGPNSRYRSERERKNDCAPRANELRQIANERADTILASTRSHKHNLVHEDAHDQRACGETVGLAARRVLFDKLDWKTFEPIGHSTSGNDIIIEYQTPTGAALTFGVAQNTGLDGDVKPGLPHGFELALWSGYWQDIPLTRTEVSIQAPNKVVIRAPGAISNGFRVRYNFAARVPGLCDTAADTRYFDQRWGGRNDPRNWPSAHEVIGNR